MGWLGRARGESYGREERPKKELDLSGGEKSAALNKTGSRQPLAIVVSLEGGGMVLGNC